MPFQSRDHLSIEGLSVLDDARPNPAQPVFENGIYLRWAFGRERAFPPYGYHLFRRLRLPADMRCLRHFLAGAGTGPVQGNGFDTPLGRISAVPLVLTEGFAPQSTSEISLETQSGIRLNLPPGVSARSVTATIGFRSGAPTQRNVAIDFRALPEKTGLPNPRVEQEVRFEVFRRGALAPATRIRRNTEEGGGLECSPQLVITLPAIASSVSLYIRRRRHDLPLVMRAYNHDGTVAFESPPTSSDWIRATLTEGTITRIVIDAPGIALLHTFEAVFAVPGVEIPVVALRGQTILARTIVTGTAGEVVTAELAADGITAVTVGRGDAALIDLCYRLTGPRIVPKDAADEQAAGPWTFVPGFPYPMTLPMTHPAYPASQGPEALTVRRAADPFRIRYGTAAEALPALQPTEGLGTITLIPGSALVQGTGTIWNESLAGSMLYPDGIDTAYAVMAVLAPDRLVLSRPFSGPQALHGVLYRTSPEDVFAQLHDQLGVLLAEPQGMRAAQMPPVFERSTPTRRITLVNGSNIVHGTGTSWTSALEGLLLEPSGSEVVYRIEAVLGLQQLKLHAEYTGASGPSAYRIRSRSPNNRLEDAAPSIDFRPLDLIELAAFSPPYAQLLGLYWIDRIVERGASYDYLLLADYENAFGLSGTAALQWANGTPDYGGTAVDGATITNLVHSGSPELAAPTSLRLFALPAGRLRLTPDRPDLADADPGLSLGDLTAWQNVQPPAVPPLFVDVWRAAHGVNPPAQIPAPAAFAATGDRFLPAARPVPSAGARPPGWPDPARIHYIDDGDDGGLDIGWYSYSVAAIDVHGRYSALSAPVPWHRGSDDAALHSYAIHLEDRTPPPPPTAVEAYVLEPADVYDATRVEDALYQQWRAAAGPQATGLRVRWRLPWSNWVHGPDLEEFRIYAQPRPLNARFHRVVSVAPAPGDATRSVVVLAAADSLPLDAYAGATLQVNERGFAIEGSSGGASLRLRVRNGGPAATVVPAAGVDATIVLQTGHGLHRELLDPLNWELFLRAVAAASPSNATVTHDIDLLEDPAADGPLKGTTARWQSSTRTLQILPPRSLTVVRPGLDRVYLKVNAASTPQDLQHFFDVESVDAVNGRMVLSDPLSLLTDNSDYEWAAGAPVRIYDTFIDDHDFPQWLAPSLAETVVYGAIGVSAADKRTEVADARPDRTPARHGNEGLLGGPATIFRVHREPPDAPADGAWDAERLIATRADYHGISRFSVRWPRPAANKLPYYKALIFRASEESLFQVDMAQQRTYPIAFSSADDPRPSHWTAARKADVLAELAKLGATPTIDAYRALNDDALSVLGNLWGNEEAFAQITIDPIDLATPQTNDRIGPDDPDTYAPRMDIQTRLDELPGRTQSRYLYRLAFVDSAQNRGPLGKASPPVYVPKVMPPRVPVVTKIVAGNRSLTVHWAANREPDLAGYHVYRADDPASAEDLRSMERVQTVTGDTKWSDFAVIELRPYTYRITAFDTAGNESRGSSPVTGRAFNVTVPPVPVFDQLQFDASGAVECRWTSTEQTLLERKSSWERLWSRLTPWLDAGTHLFVDGGDGGPYTYRLRARNRTGLEAVGEALSPDAAEE
jgi:hypothetical protein